MSATSFINGDLISCKISITNSRIPAWRRVLVPVDYTFKELHDVIMAVMEWDDYHLHAFRFEDPMSGEEIEIGGGPGVEEYGWDEFDDDKCYLPESTPIAPYLKQYIRYEYDFGCSWEHFIEFEKIVDASCNVKYPKCIGGKEMPPPEDACPENERGLVFDLKRMDSNLSKCRQFVKKDKGVDSKAEKNSSIAFADKSTEVKPLQESLAKRLVDDCSQSSTSTQTIPIPSVFALSNLPRKSDELTSGCRRCEGMEDIDSDDFGKYVATSLKLVTDREMRANLRYDIQLAIKKYSEFQKPT